MEPHQIKCAVVGQMHRDGIYVGRQIADVESVARYAVPSGEVHKAIEEIEDYMIPDEECPVVRVAPGVIGLEPDEAMVVAYLERYCEDVDDLPPNLRDLG